MNGVGLDLDQSIDILRAVGEPTRARIIAVLSHGECSVSDLCDILGQSQPRISRHLRLLVDAGVCRRNREGTFAFFSLNDDDESNAACDLIASVVNGFSRHDPVLSADRARLVAVRERRAEAAHQHFAELAGRWDRERSLLTPDDLVEAAIIDVLGPPATPLGAVIDVGTGTGRMIELLSPFADRLVGLDASPSMLRVARANLDRAGIHHAELRQADIFATTIPAHQFDLAIVHQVLHYLDDPDRALVAAADMLAPTGRLLVVDLPRHQIETLRTEHAHRRLGFTDEQLETWFRAAGLQPVSHHLIHPPDGDTTRIAVGLWLAERAV